MVRVRMRILPEGYSYSKSFHILFSTLCKEVKKTPSFYRELTKIRSKINLYGIESILEVIEEENVLSKTATNYFNRMKKELPLVGLELQGRVLTFLMSLKMDSLESK